MIVPSCAIAVVGGHVPSSSELEAVVRLGECSAVLVSRTVLVTSAHCIARQNGPVRVLDADVKLLTCTRHPGHVPGRAVDDIGFCTLEHPAPTAGIPLDDGANPATGAPILIAGFGKTGPFEKNAGVLRVVETTVEHADDSVIRVGTPERTACGGDSGGPVLVRRKDGTLAVAAITQGAAGAVCAGPADAVPVQHHQAWLESALRHVSEGHGSVWLALGGVVVILVVGASARLTAKAFARARR